MLADVEQRLLRRRARLSHVADRRRHGVPEAVHPPTEFGESVQKARIGQPERPGEVDGRPEIGGQSGEAERTREADRAPGEPLAVDDEGMPAGRTVIIRDVILLAGYFILFMVSGERMAVRPSAVGKATTFFQLGSVTIVLIGVVWPHAAPPALRTAIFVLAGVATAVSGLQYMAGGMLWLQGRGDDVAGPSLS